MLMRLEIQTKLVEAQEKLSNIQNREFKSTITINLQSKTEEPDAPPAEPAPTQAKT